MGREKELTPPVEAFANGGKVWVAISGETELAGHLDTPEAVDELIAALENARLQAWPELKQNAAN